MPVKPEALSIYKSVTGYVKQYDDNEALNLAQDYYNEDSREVMKYAFEKQWFVNIAFFMGYQNMIWDESTRSLREPRSPSYRMRIVSNKIFPYVMRSHAIMTSTRIPWTCVANSTDKADIDAARTGIDVLEHYENELDLDDTRDEAELWAQCTGTTFLKCVHDPAAGAPRRIYLDPNTGEPMADIVIQYHPEIKEKLDMMESYVEVKDGAVHMENVNPFRIFVDPYVARFKDLRWMMEVSEKPKSYYYDRFPDKADKIETAKSHSRSAYFEKRLMNFNGVFGISPSTEMRTNEESAEEMELWIAPGRSKDGKKKYPNGRHILIAGGQVLINSDNPYYKMGFGAINRHGFPYQPLYWARVPGRIWGSSLVEQLLSNQRLYNYVRSRIAEGFRVMGAKKWAVPRNANLRARSLTSGIEVLEYDTENLNGMRPEPVQPVGPAPEYMEIQGRCDSDMQQISSQPEAVQGEAPGSVKSGIGIEHLQEKGLLAMNPLIRQREIAWGKVGSMVLRIVGETTTEETLIKIHGRDRMNQVKRFKGSDLRGNYDVRVPIGRMRPESKAQKYELGFAMAREGVLNPAGNPKDRAAILRLTKFAEDEEWFRQEEADRYRACQENELMTDPLMPQIPPINEFDVDEIHMEEHDYLCKSDVFQTLPPRVQAGILSHRAAHLARIQQKMMQQMMMQESARGAPGQKGSPGKAASGKSSLSGGIAE